MSLLTLPQGRIPIGVATINGQRVTVDVDPEWMRFFTILTARAGGITGVSTTELVESSFEDAGINEMQAQMYANEQGQNQRSTAELQARIDALEAEIQSIKQGYLL